MPRYRMLLMPCWFLLRHTPRHDAVAATMPLRRATRLYYDMMLLLTLMPCHAIILFRYTRLMLPLMPRHAIISLLLDAAAASSCRRRLMIIFRARPRAHALYVAMPWRHMARYAPPRLFSAALLMFAAAMLLIAYAACFFADFFLLMMLAAFR